MPSTLRRFVPLFLALNALPVCAQPISFRPIEVPVGYATSSLVVAELNGDGIPDLVATYSDSAQAGINRMVALLGKGDGSFVAQPIDCDFGSSAPDPFLTAGIVVAALDLNGDGKPDLLATNTSPVSPRTILLIGNGDGTFQPSKVVASEILRRVADFNGDGKPDLLLFAENTDTFSVRLGNGDGTFQPPLTVGVMPFVVSLAVGDFNKDGKLDIAFAKGAFTDQGFIWIWPGNGDGTFGAVFPVSSSIGVSAGAYPLMAVDFNGDGKLDLPLTVDSALPFTTPPHGTEILFGNGDWTFRSVSSPASFGNSQGFGDFNGDGRLDVAIDSSVMPGSADGTQAPVPVFTCTNGKCVPVPIDLSGDPVYLSLYGTGFRRSNTSSTAVSCEIVSAHMNAATTYVGPQGTFPGLDQLNIRLPKLSGAGETDLVCQFSYDSSERIYHSNAFAPPVRVGIK